MRICSKGHANPDDWAYCGDCGRQLPAGTDAVKAWYRPGRRVILGIVAALVVVGAATVVVVVQRGERSLPGPDGAAAAVQQWWSTAGEHVTGLRDSVGDAQVAVDRLDAPGLEAACGQIHEEEVRLQAHLPSPDPELTAELHAAIEDAHSAAHMCLAVVEGSVNRYDGEFPSTLDQVDRRLDAAQDIVNGTIGQA